MKTKIITILLIGSFIFSNSKTNLNPVIKYQDYLINNVEKREKKKTIITYIVGSSFATFFITFAANSIKTTSKNRSDAK
jgi:hypothetical protein